MQTNSKKSATRSASVKNLGDDGTVFDGVLRRMLGTPPDPHKPKISKLAKKKPAK